MFVQITKNKSLRECDVVGIFDLDSATIVQGTRKFLSGADKSGRTVGGDSLPKSFVLTDSKIYFSPRLPGYICKGNLNKKNDLLFFFRKKKSKQK